MYSRRSSFFEIVVKLPGFKGSGKIPVTNGSLMSLEIGILYFLKSLVGILFGPIEFFWFCNLFGVVFWFMDNAFFFFFFFFFFFGNCCEKPADGTV